VEAGLLDRRVILWRATVTKDAFNADVVTWVQIATVWGSRKDVRDSERFRAAEVNAQLTARFVIRWSSDVADLNAEDQLESEGRRYAISAVKEIGRREGLEITASAQVNAP
jgi:SPP1 family predicted phage head-tail adaptor